MPPGIMLLAPVSISLLFRLLYQLWSIRSLVVTAVTDAHMAMANGNIYMEGRESKWYTWKDEKANTVFEAEQSWVLRSDGPVARNPRLMGEARVR